MTHEQEFHRMQAATVLQNEAERDPRRGRKWRERADPKPDGFATKENFHNRTDVRMRLYLCDSVKAKLKELDDADRMRANKP